MCVRVQIVVGNLILNLATKPWSRLVFRSSMYSLDWMSHHQDCSTMRVVRLLLAVGRVAEKDTVISSTLLCLGWLASNEAANTCGLLLLLAEIR